MKKTLRFVLAALFALASVSSFAQITSVDELSNDKIYSIKCNHSYLGVNTENKMNVYNEPYRTFNEDANKFAVLKTEKGYYFYATERGRFMPADGTDALETPDGAFSIEPSSQDGKFLIINKVNNCWIMLGGSAQFLNADGWTIEDDGDLWEISEIDDLGADVKAAALDRILDYESQDWPDATLCVTVSTAESPVWHIIRNYGCERYLRGNGWYSLLCSTAMDNSTFWRFELANRKTGALRAYTKAGEVINGTWSTGTTTPMSVYILPNGVNENGYVISADHTVGANCASYTVFAGFSSVTPDEDNWEDCTWVIEAIPYDPTIYMPYASDMAQAEALQARLTQAIAGNEVWISADDNQAIQAILGDSYAMQITEAADNAEEAYTSPINWTAENARVNAIIANIYAARQAVEDAAAADMEAVEDLQARLTQAIAGNDEWISTEDSQAIEAILGDAYFMLVLDAYEEATTETGVYVSPIDWEAENAKVDAIIANIAAAKLNALLFEEDECWPAEVTGNGADEITNLGAGKPGSKVSVYGNRAVVSNFLGTGRSLQCNYMADEEEGDCGVYSVEFMGAESNGADTLDDEPGVGQAIEIGGKQYVFMGGQIIPDATAGSLTLLFTEVATAQNAYVHYVWGDLATAIGRAEGAQEAAAAYNLAGQRVAKANGGLYIIGGKKAVVK